MKRPLILTFLAIVILSTFVVGQLGWTFPQNINLNPNWNILPSPQPNQKIFGCPYVLPMQLRDFRYYSSELNGGTITAEVSFSLHTGNKRSACSVPRQNITISLFNIEGSLENYIITQSSQNINNDLTNQGIPL
jgi:hypothetical protein